MAILNLIILIYYFNLLFKYLVLLYIFYFATRQHIVTI